jgi:hypothetical protein
VHLVRHDLVGALGVPQTLFVDAEVVQAKVFEQGQNFLGFLEQHEAEGLFLAAGSDADLDIEAPFVDFALAVQSFLLAQQCHLLVVVLLLFAFELLYGLDHVELVEAFVFGQTVDLAAEGIGLVQELEAEWGVGYAYCLQNFSSIRKGEYSAMGAA